MKKIWKKVLSSVLAISLCVGTFMTTNWNVASAEDTTNPATTLEVSGASIRFIYENTAVDGIRFAVRVTEDAYKALTPEQKKNYHLLVMPTVLVDGELEKGEKYEYTSGGDTKYAYAQDVKIDWEGAEVKGGYATVRIYLNEIDASYYTTEITARAYYQEGENSPIYSSSIERSYYTVADKALNDLNAEQTEIYKNAVGAAPNYSPYNATQRNALLGVKYVKEGTWDYIDGNLVQTSALATDSLSDRNVRTDEGQQVIYTSFKTRKLDEVKQDTEETKYYDWFGGFQFAYNSKTGSFIELNYMRINDTLVPTLRGRDLESSVWNVYTSSNGTLEPDTLYDFAIIMNRQTDSMDIQVMYRKSGVGANFASLITGYHVPYTYTSNNQQYTVTYGNETRMYAGRALSGHTYSAEIGYSDSLFALNDRNKTITELENGFQISGTGESGNVLLVDFDKVNNENNNANFVLTADMVWENKSTDAYLQTGYEIGGGDFTAFGAKLKLHCSPKGLLIDSTYYELASLKNSVQGLDEVIDKIAAGIPVTWKVVAKTVGTTTTVKCYLDELLCAQQEVANSKMWKNYILYVADSNVTFDNMTLSDQVPEDEPDETPKYEITRADRCTATLTETTNGVTINQTKGGEVWVKDLVNVLPNTTNFRVEVDMPAISSEGVGINNAQGIVIGDRTVLINNNRVSIDNKLDGTAGWQNYLFSWYPSLNGIADTLKQNEFTFIVTVSGNFVYAGVRVNGTETQVMQHVLTQPLTNTTFGYFNSTQAITADSEQTTFSNVQFKTVDRYQNIRTQNATMTLLDGGAGFSLKPVSTVANPDVYVKDLYTVLPNKDDITVSVDVSPVIQNGTVVVQGLALGNVQIRMADWYLQVITGDGKAWSGWNTTDHKDILTIPDEVKSNSFTMIYRIYKDNGQQKIDVKVKVNGVETTVMTGIAVDNITATNLTYHTWFRNTGDNWQSSFSNIKVIDNVTH